MGTNPPTLTQEAVEGTAHVLRCLGHPLRLRVLDVLEREGESTVTEIYEALGVEQAVASQHLTTMWDKGILRRRKDGVHLDEVQEHSETIASTTRSGTTAP